MSVLSGGATQRQRTTSRLLICAGNLGAAKIMCLLLTELEKMRILDLGPILVLLGVFRRANSFAIENFNLNAIYWRIFSVRREALAGATSDCDTLCFGRTTLGSRTRIRLRFSVWSARNAFAVA